MTLSDFLIFIANRSLSNSKLYIQPGHNGPYNDPETPVRNYGHWLIVFSKCYELTGEQMYLEKIKELAEYLISYKARPYGYSFCHRSKESKDKCNGLIGQAWTFEALAYASSITKDSKYIECARKVFSQHNFNESLGLWNRLEIDGEVLSVDSTFNHQLWFAASASMLITSRKNEIYEKIISFLDALNKNLTILDNGLIYHPIENQIYNNKFDLFQMSHLKKKIYNLFHFLGIRNKLNYNVIRQKSERMIYKSIGYHHFNMYAFAMLKEKLPDHQFMLSSEFGRSVDYLLSDQFKDGLIDNIYGFLYNPPGFEVPYALSILTDLNQDEIINLSSWWVDEQFRRCYNSQTQMLDRNTKDPLTNIARIYELARLPNSILDKIEVDIQIIDDLT